MIKVPNWSVSVPRGSNISITIKVAKNKDGENRGANVMPVTLDGEQEVLLPFSPFSTEWLEVFDSNNLVVLNPRVKNEVGRVIYETYNVEDNKVIFNQPMTGTFTLVCDTAAAHHYSGTVIPIKNKQGSLTSLASLFVYPVIVTQPSNGYARISTDRKSMVYRPKTKYYGYDSFSYCLINNHGQYSRNFCVYIKVGK